jgi:hypothetical protein
MPNTKANLNEMLANVSLVEEVETELGDDRRTKRLQQVVERIAQSPAASFVEIFEDPTELKGFYRLVNNNNIEPLELLDGHKESTIARAMCLEEVLVIHDTTENSYPIRSDRIRPCLAKLSAQRQGFSTHASLVATADGQRCPLGMIGLRSFVSKSQIEGQGQDAIDYWMARDGILESEHDKWLQAVKEAESDLSGPLKVIHLMDREGDSYEDIATMAVEQWAYVIRLAQERNVRAVNSDETIKISELLAQQPVVAQRIVTLSPRYDSGRTLSAKKSHPSRRQRIAFLSFRGCALEMPRPATPKKDLSHLPKHVRVNVVEVFEEHPPEGEPAVRWLLVTSEPIDTVEGLVRVVDLYRARWLIEEFFKALKTGCSYTKRPLDSAHSLLSALSILSPVAWHLLLLRHLHREASELPAHLVLSVLQIALLQAKYPKHPWSDEPTIGEAVGAIAKLGGHQKSNGAAGWQVLGRGYARLVDMEQGARAMESLDMESLEVRM